MWFVGVTLCICGCIFSSVGLILQKHSFNVGEEKLPLLRRWRWWLGCFCLLITGAVLDGIALMWTPLSIIGPLSGLTIISNSVLAMHFLGENASTLDLGATLIVVLGTVLTSAFGSHESPDYDAEALIGLFEHWYIPLYYLCTLGILFGSALVLAWRKRPSWVDMFAFANIAGCLGGNQNAFLKCSMELVKESIRDGGANQSNSPMLYFTILATLTLGAGQLYLMNVGLSRHSAVAFLPGYQSALTVYGCMAGGVYFQEFWNFSMAAWAFFPLGILLILTGLWALKLTQTTSSQQVKPHERGKVGVNVTDSNHSGFSENAPLMDADEDADETPRSSVESEDREIRL